MTGKIVCHQVGITSRYRCTDWTYHFQACVGVIGTDVLQQCGIAQSHSFTVRAGKRLWLIWCEYLAAIVQLKVGPRQNTLHRVVCGVTCAGGSLLITVGA